ncbi:hypothetical protein V6N12_033075 [Hibiscus sabdariffa]|uniref:Uncharacterized protein n=1 Tax=Hibiscus sabdariffa TaxID=183260 RepID=A0ABR2BCQ5_9ROSI
MIRGNPNEYGGGQNSKGNSDGGEERLEREQGKHKRENVVNINKGLSSRAISEDKVNDNDIGSVELKVGPKGISSQLPEPLSVNTDKKFG